MKERYDLAVIGSGAAGLSAAIAAADLGAKVIVLEAAPLFGGTTAVSAGMMWIPGSDEAKAEGIDDDPEDVRRHLRHVGGDDVPQELIDTFVEYAPKVLAYLQKSTPLKVGLVPDYPDYHPEAPGGRGRGRVLDPEPFSTDRLGEFSALLRRSPLYAPITARERDGWSRLENRWDHELIESRRERGEVTLGCALVGALLLACIEKNVKLRVGTRLRDLTDLDESGMVLTVETSEGEETLVSRNGVVLATGGFEWNDELKSTFLRGPLEAPASPPTGTGDGLQLAQKMGAKLRNMSEAWWFPTVHFGEEYEGRPLYRMLLAERNMPGSLIVNRNGKRFVNEAANYNDMTKALHEFDPVEYRYRNVPAFLIFDRAFRSRYTVFGVSPEQPDSDLPEGVYVFSDLGELSKQFQIDHNELLETVKRFNGFAEDGTDRDYHRGESLFDRHEGDSEHAPNPNLAPLETAPFYCIEVHPGALGTKGGPATDRFGRVLDIADQAIPGLYACGNVAAGLPGIGYVGAGATLGPALTFGVAAGATAAVGEGGLDTVLSGSR